MKTLVLSGFATLMDPAMGNAVFVALVLFQLWNAAESR